MVQDANYSWGAKDKMLLPIVGLFYLILNVISWQFPFFWDSTHGAIAANFYLENNFNSFVLPGSLDAGHTPGFDLYLAGIWKLFGQKLWLSHLAMLPFLLGTLFQYWKLCKRFLEEKYFLIAILLFLLEPALLTQSTMVSADIALVFFYLLAVNGIFEKRRILLALALCGLAMVSFRGVIALSAIFLSDVLISLTQKGANEWLKKLMAYLPVSILVLAWLMLHHATSGWWLFTPDESYSAGREFIGIGGILRNTGIAIWRLLDNGRLFLWLFILPLAIFILRGSWRFGGNILHILILLLVPIVLFTLTFLPLSNTIGHRYYMVAYVFLILGVVWFLQQIESIQLQKVISAILVLGLMTGHFWVYPDTVAKGWDSTLAHIPWFSLRAKVLDEIAQREIPLDEICSDFPNLSSPEISDLNIEYEGQFLKDKNESGIESCNYVFQSNIMNGFSDEELIDLKENWILLKEFKRLQVHARLYKRPSAR